MLKFILLSLTALILAGCSSTSSNSTPQNEETFTPNWETHARDAEVMSGKGPTPASEATPVPTSDEVSEQALEAQQFVTINFTNLGRDLRAGQGKHLNELLRILRISKTQQAPAIRQLKSLYEGSQSPVQFSQDLWSWYKRR